MTVTNPYDDGARAATYAKLDIRNTYVLAYRDLPDLITRHGIAGSALDYGCGTGRSTRFLRDLGFTTVGVDISEAMIAQAREHDPGCDYRLIDPGDLAGFSDGTFDLVLSVMPFDSIASRRGKIDTLVEISRVLKPGGWKILVASSRDIYLREWASFSTADFPDNRSAKDGDTVRVVIKDLDDGRTVEDVLWTEAAYVETFTETPLRLVEIERPLARDGDDQCAWISERTHAPWIVFVLRKPI